MALLEHFNWKRIGIISEKSAVPRGIHDALSEDTLRKNIDITVQACKVQLTCTRIGVLVCSAPPITLHLPHIAMLLSTKALILV